MRIAPKWWLGVLVFLAYCAIVFGLWAVVGVDYATVGNEANIGAGIILPLGVCAVFLVAVVTGAGWWRPVLFEQRRSGPSWVLPVMLLLFVVFIGLGLVRTNWAALSPTHLVLLAVATLLVGFCEETLTRGVALVSLRGSLRSEGWAWFWSSVLFGLLHLPNGLFGAGAGAILQAFFAFAGGSGLYLLRRTSGSLILPMLVHAAWDFSTFSMGVSGGTTTDATQLIIQFGSYLASLVFVAVVLLRGQPPRVVETAVA